MYACVRACGCVCVCVCVSFSTRDSKYLPCTLLLFGRNYNFNITLTLRSDRTKPSYSVVPTSSYGRSCSACLCGKMCTNVVSSKYATLNVLCCCCCCRSTIRNTLHNARSCYYEICLLETPLKCIVADTISYTN